jgi:hypothetical protein
MKLNNLEIYKSIRKTWSINPRTKIKDKKRKSRQQSKIDLKREV